MKSKKISKKPHNLIMNNYKESLRLSRVISRSAKADKSFSRECSSGTRRGESFRPEPNEGKKSGSSSWTFGPPVTPKKSSGAGVPPANGAWNARVAYGIGGTGFQPVHFHRQDAGATKDFSEQFLMGQWPTRKA
jgi:hypothetical protein